MAFPQGQVKTWLEFVSIASVYPEHLIGKCPKCTEKMVSIPAGEYYEVAGTHLMPGHRICLKCSHFIKAYSSGFLVGGINK